LFVLLILVKLISDHHCMFKLSFHDLS
jgi:hypothetical protein